METPITHEQIYARLIEVEAKVENIDKNTEELVGAFKAVQGAFKVLGWIASAAKPILWIAGVCASIGIFWAQVVKK